MDQPEDLTGSAAVPAGATLARGTHVVLIDVVVPSGATFWLDSFANFADDVAAFGTAAVSWTLLVDGVPHPRFNKIRDQIGLQVNPRVLPEGLVKARARFQLIAENEAAAQYTAGGSIQGRYRGNR